jgi:hypothetical protein
MKQIYFFFLYWLFAFQTAAQDCSQFTFTQSVTESRCAATGTISISATGGSGNYNYRVTGPVVKPATSSSTITGLPAGYYTVIVSDVDSGCLYSRDSVFIPGTYQDPRFQLTKTNVSCLGNDGAIQAENLQYGRAPFTYRLISPSPSGVGSANATGTFSGLVPGEYYVQLQDSCGGIQVRRITVETYNWWFDGNTVTRVGCDSADISIRLLDNRGNSSTGTGFAGFSYGVIRAAGDTVWSSTPDFRIYIGTRRALTLVAKDNCGGIHTSAWTLPANLKPSIGTPAVSHLQCSTFTVTVPSQQNLTSPVFCLKDAANNTVSCNSTGIFTSVPYGSYCITMMDACYDTTITRCFSTPKPVPSVAASVTISNKACTTFSAAVTGQANLINPQYCLYSDMDALISCNTTGIFTAVPYGTYCIKIQNGCADTIINRCFTVTKPVAALTSVNLSGISCSGLNVTVNGDNLLGPVTYCLYDSLGNVDTCNTTGIFNLNGHGSYCVKAATVCGDSTNTLCFTSIPPKPVVAATVQTSNKTCTGFNAEITGQQNLVTPQYCLYASDNDSLISCNATGQFLNIPYGSYCIKIKGGCYDTTIIRCFTEVQAMPTVSATLQAYNPTCTGTGIRVVGMDLNNPTYCLYDVLDTLLQCNSTGLFDNIPYGTYCVVVRDGCVDTSFRICQTFEPLRRITMATNKNCGINTTNIYTQFESPNAPYTVDVYHPNGSLVHTMTTSTNPYHVVLPVLGQGQEYKIIGADACGLKDTAFIMPDGNVVKKTVTIRPKCPSAAWQNGSADIEVTLTSDWYPVIPAIIKKNGVAFNQGFASQSGPNYTISDLEPAVYIIQYTMQNCNSRIYDTLAVAPYSYPQQGQSAIYQCDNNSFSLGANVQGGISPYTYQIIGSSPDSPSINAVQYNNPVFNINNGTTYSLVRLRSIDVCGNATLADVSVLPLQNIAVTASSTCFYDDITLTVDTIPNASYTWYRKTSLIDSTLIGTGLSFNLPFFRPEQVGIYICKVSVNNGCLIRLSSFVLNGYCGQIFLPAGISLKGKRAQKKHQLTWQVTDEQDVRFYELQRRKGNQFKTVSHVKSKNAPGKTEYNFDDPVQEKGASQYRVRALLINGKSVYSNTVVIHQRILKAKVYPNPVKTSLNIVISDEEPADYRFELLNAVGVTIWKKDLKNIKDGSFNYNRNGLPAGTYFLRISNLTFDVSEVHKILLE